jgi:hypothetical protein
MNDRDIIAHKLAGIEQNLKELVIRYEQYFAGGEKREPLKERESLAGRLRRFANHRITQTDLRFKYQNLATRFHTYTGYWDRILRQMDEGHNARHVPCRKEMTDKEISSAQKDNQVDEVIYRELLEAHRTCKIEGAAPNQKQVAAFLEKQKDKIQEKFGDRKVEFRVVIEDGKPKIKVRPKN